MTRAEIIELIQNKYDRTPDHLPPNNGWDDGTGEIADIICARIAELEADLSGRTARARIGELEGRLERQYAILLQHKSSAERAEAELSTVRNRINELENANTYNRQMVREVTTELSTARAALDQLRGTET